LEATNGKTKADILRESRIIELAKVTPFAPIEEQGKGTRVLKVMPLAPVPIGTIIPKGWMINENGLFQRRYNKDGEELEPKIVTYEPIVIVGIFDNLTDESEGLIVSWHNGREWKEIAHSRDIFMASNKIIDLSGFGFPVNSNNTKVLIQYLTDFYACNRTNLPFKSYSEQLGWINEGFLLGNQYLSNVEKKILFHPADVGEKQIAEGFQAKGDIETWLDITDRIKEFPSVINGVYASLGSVISKILKVDSFIWEWSGDTSKGKTIALKMAASVWGKPTTEQGGIIKKWNVTPVNIERTASLLNNLPLFLDDTKDLARTNAVANLIYNLASGQGKGRGSTKGSQKTRYWNNITISTGEQKITTFTKDGGTAARVLPITGLPFGRADTETAQLVESIELDIQECYGVAGEVWIRYIQDNKKCWGDWKTLYLIASRQYSHQANGNSVVGRLAKYMGLINVAAYLFNDCFNKDYDYLSIINISWQRIVEENAEVDRPLQALKTVYSWMVANKHKFKNDHWADSYGTWNHEREWQEVYILPHILEELLSSKGYEPTSIIESWNNRGWLITQKSRGLKKQKTIRGVKTDYIAIRKEALEQ
jgi:uncharacterized protein (DUF927 family)